METTDFPWEPPAETSEIAEAGSLGLNPDMKSILAISLAILSAAVGCPARQPNVIVIFTDDQGSVDAGCYGTEDIETPNIDLLAERGSRFTQFYAAAPVCSPSRAGLLTGRYPLRAGVPGNTTSVKGKPGMPGEQVTIAETFKAAGYRTAHIGKWHLGYIPEHMPNAQGFDHSFGHMGGCIDNYSHFFYWQGPNRHDLHRNGEEIFADGEFFPDLMVREACEFIRDNQADPFFIYFAMNSPHYPYQGEAHWLKRYADLPLPRKLYNAFVSTLDSRIGDLMRYLDEVGLTRRHNHRIPIRSWAFDRGARPLWWGQLGRLSRSQVQPLRRRDSCSCDHQLAGASARREGRSTNSATRATGCQPSPSWQASTFKSQTSMA